MASPFSIFRRHQRVLMVVVTGLAMFSFVVLDSANMAQTGRPSPWVTIVLLAGIGALATWIVGLSQGHGGRYAAWGAAVGAALGVGLQLASAPAPAVRTSLGSLSHADLDGLLRKRNIANRFVTVAYQSILQKHMESAKDNPQMQRFLQMQMEQFANRRAFGFGRGDDGPAGEQDVVFGWLMQKEADRLGLVVSDKVIQDFIDDVTGNEMTTAMFKESCRRTGASESAVFDALRAELRATHAQDLLRPRDVPTPEALWDAYCQLRVQRRIEYAAVPVETFVKDVEKPTDQALRAFFEEHRTRGPGVPDEDSVGFRQERRIQLGYLLLNLDKFHEKTIGEAQTKLVSAERRTELRKDAAPEMLALLDRSGDVREIDVEVVQYYLDNKETEFKNPVLKDDAAAPGTTPPSGPRLDGPQSPSPQTDPPRSETPKPEAPKPETPKPEAPKSEGAGDEDEEADDAEEVEDGAADAAEALAAALQLLAPGSATPEVAVAELEGADAGEALAEARKLLDAPPPLPPYKPLDESRADSIRERLLDRKASAALTAATRAAADHLRTFSSKYQEPPLGGSIGLAPAKFAAAAAEYAKAHGLQYVTTELTDYRTFRKTERALSAATPPSAASMFEAPVQIPDLLYRNRSDGAHNDQLYDVSEAVNLFGGLSPDADADELRFVYWKTADSAPHVPLFEPVVLDARRPLKEANDKLGFDWQKPTAPDLTLARHLAEVHGGPAKKDDVIRWQQLEAKVLEVDEAGGIVKVEVTEPGIRELVERAWLRERARPKAKERAEKLAALVKSGADLAAALKDETVTGSKDGPKLVVRQTPPEAPFSWYEESQAPSLGMRSTAVPRLVEIPGIEEGGNGFHAAVSGLDPGQVGVAPNGPKSIFYVVRVVQRIPENPDADETFRKGFMRRVATSLEAGGSTNRGPIRLDGAEGMLVEMTAQQQGRDWFRNFEKQFDVRWSDGRE